MNRRSFSGLVIILLLSIMFTMGGCSNAEIPGRSSDEVISDLVVWLTDNNIGTITYREGTELNYISDTELMRQVDIDYLLGDVEYHRQYEIKYGYSVALGWTVSEVEPISEDAWTVGIGNSITIDRLIEDLEGENYLSQYSDHTFEVRRVLESTIVDESIDPDVGYDRINARFVLDADYVHEIVDVETEYLLDDKENWYMFASNLTLASVNVQKGVDDSVITEAVNSLNYYSDADESTWSLGSLERITYDISERNLDTDTSTEDIDITFRGEGEYMYISGSAKLEFKFSSGWYLYNSDFDEASIETGMLSDEWLVTEEDVLDSIVNDNRFDYDNVSYPVTEDMIYDLKINSTKITELGKYQTAYFTYYVKYNKTKFYVDGYGKYELTSSGLQLETWNDIPEAESDLSGTWYGIDVTSSYIAFYVLDIDDDNTGIFSGNISVYGADMSGSEAKNVNAEASIVGNVLTGLEYEVLLDKWSTLLNFTEEKLPNGKYDFTTDELTVDNSVGKNLKLTRNKPDNWLEQKALNNIIASGNVKNIIKNY